MTEIRVELQQFQRRRQKQACAPHRMLIDRPQETAALTIGSALRSSTRRVGIKREPSLLRASRLAPAGRTLFAPSLQMAEIAGTILHSGCSVTIFRGVPNRCKLKRS